MAMDSIPEAMLVRAVVRWRCTATSNVDAPQGVVRLVQAHSLGAYWQTWPHVAARRSCFGAAAGRCYVQPSPSFSQLSRHAGVGQCVGYQGMPWSRQGAPRIAASATSIECSLGTRHGHDGSPASLSTSASLLAGAGERGQVHVPGLAAGWVGFAVLGILFVLWRACLLASTAVGVELPAPVPLALLCTSCALVRQCRCGCSRSGCRRRRGAKRGAPKRGALQRQRRRHARLPPSAVMPEWLGVRVGAGVCVEQRGHFSTLVHQQFARDEGFASVGPCEPTSLTRSSSVDSGGAGP